MPWFSTCLLVLGAIYVAQAYVTLSKDSSTEQIFVGGNWYNKDGSSGKPTTAGVNPLSVFSQCLHHANLSGCGCDTTWSQKYWVDRRHYKKGGPIFIEIAGEWDASGDISYGYWFEYARECKAIVIVLEHRFYGGSFPVENPSVSDLWLMTSQLALADAANFIRTYTRQNKLQGAKWVAFGCSYGANLAAWMKLGYPDLIKAVVSSSGPVEAIDDYPGYTNVISEVIQAVEPDCFEELHATFSCIEALVNGFSSSCLSYNSPDELLEPLQYGYPVDWSSNSQKENFFGSLAYTAFANNDPVPQVRYDCGRLRKSPGSDIIEKFGNFYKRKSRGSFQTTLQERKEFLQAQEAWASGVAAWSWQTCNEFGYYMSADPQLGAFGYNTFSGDMYASSCQYYYGEKYTQDHIQRQIDATNNYYGGKNIKSKCIIFVHGTWDPWHTQGVTKSLKENTVIVVPRTSHCADNSQATTKEMQQAQRTIKKQIGVYLNDPKC